MGTEALLGEDDSTWIKMIIVLKTIHVESNDIVTVLGSEILILSHAIRTDNSFTLQY